MSSKEKELEELKEELRKMEKEERINKELSDVKSKLREKNTPKIVKKAWKKIKKWI